MYTYSTPKSMSDTKKVISLFNAASLKRAILGRKTNFSVSSTQKLPPNTKISLSEHDTNESK